ncbi:MAG: AraC family transcriptional regulator [Pseudomonadota bacterium]
MIKALIYVSIFLQGSFLSTSVYAEDSAETTSSLNNELQDLKEQILELNRDLFILEEDLLFPASTQVSVFVSMDIGILFELDSVSLKLNDKNVTNYLYTKREVEALRRGGVQRLYLGNLPTGEHELIAIFIGQGPDGRDFKRATSLRFEKNTGTKMIELKITDDESKLQPRFAIKEWQ